MDLCPDNLRQQRLLSAIAIASDAATGVWLIKAILLLRRDCRAVLLQLLRGAALPKITIADAKAAHQRPLIEFCAVR